MTDLTVLKQAQLAEQAQAMTPEQAVLAAGREMEEALATLAQATALCLPAPTREVLALKARVHLRRALVYLEGGQD